jgi:hypothetical protein
MQLSTLTSFSMVNDHEPEPTQAIPTTDGEPLIVPVPKRDDVMAFLEKTARPMEPHARVADALRAIPRGTGFTFFTGRILGTDLIGFTFGTGFILGAGLSFAIPNVFGTLVNMRSPLRASSPRTD